MPNDDLGQFPMPSNQQTPPTPPASEPTVNPEPQITSSEPQFTAPELPPTAAPAFEETPEEIPAYSPPAQPIEANIPEVILPVQELHEDNAPFVQPAPDTPPNPPAPPQPIPVTATPSSGLNMGPIIFTVLFLVAIVALAGAAFLYQQTNSLKGQLSDITKTLQKQETSPETTPTPSVVEIPTSPTLTPSVTPISTISATPTATPTITYVPGSPLKPLSVAPKIMQIAIKHSPNAQFILMKTESANDPANASTKYFFRQDLKTKKYFYILISGSDEPELVDKQIYVTPDDNIPSLNDLVLQNTLGIDLDEAIVIVNSFCTDKDICRAASAKAQYIKTATAVIWQVSLTVSGKAQPMVMQINAQTKEVIFKTEDFAK